MTIIEALLLGLVQGITEFIPVSSSGHLAIIENLLNISREAGLPFAAAVHLATVTAVVAALRREIKKLLMEFCRSLYDAYENIRTYFHNRHEKDARRYKKIISNNYRKLFLLIVIAAIPTAVEGFLLQDVAELAKPFFQYCHQQIYTIIICARCRSSRHTKVCPADQRLNFQKNRPCSFHGACYNGT